MEQMIADCTSLEVLDLSNWDLSNINVSMGQMVADCISLNEIRLDNCDTDTISKIITSYRFPVNNYGTIYCRRANAEGLTAPGNWSFSYID